MILAPFHPSYLTTHSTSTSAYRLLQNSISWERLSIHTPLFWNLPIILLSPLKMVDGAHLFDPLKKLGSCQKCNTEDWIKMEQKKSSACSTLLCMSFIYTKVLYVASHNIIHLSCFIRSIAMMIDIPYQFTICPRFYMYVFNNSFYLMPTYSPP